MSTGQEQAHRVRLRGRLLRARRAGALRDGLRPRRRVGQTRGVRVVQRTGLLRGTAEHGPRRAGSRDVAAARGLRLRRRPRRAALRGRGHLLEAQRAVRDASQTGVALQGQAPAGLAGRRPGGGGPDAARRLHLRAGVADLPQRAPADLLRVPGRVVPDSRSASSFFVICVLTLACVVTNRRINRVS